MMCDCIMIDLNSGPYDVWMCMYMALPAPTYFRALTTSVQPIYPLLEVHYYWKVSFGACRLSVVLRLSNIPEE